MESRPTMVLAVIAVLLLLFDITDAQSGSFWEIEMLDPISPLKPDEFVLQRTSVKGVESCDISIVSTMKVEMVKGVNTYYYKSEVTDNFWYGSERNGQGSASVSAFTFDGKCYIIGRVVSGNVGCFKIIKTKVDGSVWAETGILLDDEVFGEDDHYPSNEETDVVWERTGDDSSGEVVDVMVPYTREAMCKVALEEPDCEATPFTEMAIRTWVDMFILESDLVFKNSQLNLSLNLVLTYMTDFVEDTSDTERTWPTTLEEMQQGINGFEGLPDLRDERCADIVNLIVASGDRYVDQAGNRRINFGRSSGIGPDVNAWNLISSLEPMAVSRFTFTHETGHLLGCRHEIESDPNDPPYAHGFIDNLATYSSIMTTRGACSGDCIRQPVFSSTKYLFEGQVIGDETNADCQRRITETQGLIASYRDSTQCIVSDEPSSSPSALPSHASPTTTPSASPTPTTTPSASPTPPTPSASPTPKQKKPPSVGKKGKKGKKGRGGQMQRKRKPTKDVVTHKWNQQSTNGKVIEFTAHH